MGGLSLNALTIGKNGIRYEKQIVQLQFRILVNLSKTIQMRNTSVEDSGYYYCELMVRGKEPIIEEVTKLMGTVPFR